MGREESMDTKYVISIDLAKRLKALGCKQRSEFWWKVTSFKGGLDHRRIDEVKLVTYYDGDYKEDILSVDFFSAFHTGELGEMLPEYFYSAKKVEEGYVCSSSSFKEYENIEDIHADTEAEARGLMLEYLISEGLVKV